MIRALLAISLISTGCFFFDVSTGVQAPTKHGYGGWGVPLSVTIGGDTDTSYGRIGAGGRAQLFVSDNLGWLTASVQARNEINLFPIWKRTASGIPYFHKQVVLVTTLSAGSGSGKVRGDEPWTDAKHVDAFIGAGVTDQRGTRSTRWFAWSAGIAATRIWIGDRDPVWFVGLAATIGGGFEKE